MTSTTKRQVTAPLRPEPRSLEHGRRGFEHRCTAGERSRRSPSAARAQGVSRGALLILGPASAHHRRRQVASMLQFDAEASRRVEATYTTPDVAEQRQAVLGALGLGRGERVIDRHRARAAGGRDRGRGRPRRAGLRDRHQRQHARAGPRPNHPAQQRPDRAPPGRRGPAPLCPGELRRRRGHPGAGVRQGRAGRAGRDLAGAAPRWPGAGAGHRLGLDRLALQRRGAHGPGAGRLGAAPGRRPSAPQIAGMAGARRLPSGATRGSGPGSVGSRGWSCPQPVAVGHRRGSLGHSAA